MLRSIGRMVMLALAAGVMWGCDGERATQPKPLGKVAAEGSAVVVVTVQSDGAPVSGVLVEISRAIAGLAASYDWSATTDENGQARIEVTSGNGYYQARVVQDGREVGYRSSIPLNVGAEVLLDFAIAALVPATDPRDLTRAYVEAAIARYERDGLDATVAYYNNPENIEGERVMMLLQAGDQPILASPLFPQFIGSNAYTAPDTPAGSHLALATAEGHWFETLALNPVTQQQEPALALAVLHDGLIFFSSHFIFLEDLADFTLDYVRRAIDRYDREGREATVAYYDSRESVDGQFYLFLIDEDDIYLAHPIFPHLKGTDIKDVVGSDGYELGKEIAKATEEGGWVDYLWPNPISGVEEPKSAWVIRHDGLIFASGYYTPDPNAEPPAWKDAEPRAYTKTYVEKAIERYDRDGLDAMMHYYNSVASFEGQWYLFMTDANDIYIVHPLFRHLIGTDIKDVVGSDGQELGKEIAAATEDGDWIEYLWPHPVTLQEVPKVAYAVRHDGLIFASGYYPEIEDPRAYTEAYVAKAIEMYDREGLDAMVAYYNSAESIDRQWFLTMFDADNKILTAAPSPNLIGMDYSVFATIAGFPEIGEIANVTEEGQWFQFPYYNPLTAEDDQLNLWVIRHDGNLFSSAYFSGD